MKGQGLNSKKSAIVILNLAWALAASFSFADEVPLPPPGIITAPPGDVFKPTLPSAGPDDSYVLYHYRRSGTGYWNDNHGDLGITDGVDDGVLTSVEETVDRYKTNGTRVLTSRSYDFRAEWSTIYCPGAGPAFVFTGYTNFCAGTNVSPCTAEEAWYCDPYGVIGDVYFVGPTNVTSLTTNSTDSSTEIIGSSFSEVTRPPGGFECQCVEDRCGVLIREHFAMEIGSLYSFDAGITNGASSSPSMSAAAFTQPLPSASPFNGSENPMTPQGGSFDGSGHFNFSFNVPTSDTYLIYASTNLVNWTNIGLVSASTTGTFLDTNAASFAGRFYLVSEGSTPALHPTSPSDIYGFASINVTTNGALIANPLLSDGLMNIGTLLTNMPEGTTLQLWSQTTTNWDPTATFSSGAWNNPQLPLIPGGGAFLTPTTNVTIRFIGQVATGLLQNPIQPGYSLCSSSLPLTGSVTNMGFPTLVSGDKIERWNATTATFNFSTLNSSGVWAPNPSVNLCEAFIVKSSTNTIWNQTYPTP